MSEGKKSQRFADARRMVKERMQKKEWVKGVDGSGPVAGSIPSEGSTHGSSVRSTPSPSVINYEANSTSAPTDNGFTPANIPYSMNTSYSSEPPAAASSLFPGSSSQGGNGEGFFDTVSSDRPRTVELEGTKHEKPPSDYFPNQYVPTPQNIPPTIAPSYNADVSSLEAQLSAERSRVAQLTLTYNQVCEQYNSLHQEMQSMKNELEQKNMDYGPLQEKVVFQAQSIEMLVSERSELQKLLDTLQEESKQNKATIEELSARLKVSRSNVARLEKDLSQYDEFKQQHNSILKKLERKMEEIESERAQLKTQMGDGAEEMKELKRRLDKSLKQISELEGRIHEKDNQLSLAHVKIQQLGGTVEEVQVNGHESAEESVPGDDQEAREEQARQQYQQYIDLLTDQTHQLSLQVQQLTSEKEQLLLRDQNWTSHVAELEKQLQKQSRGQSQNELVTQNSQLKKELEHVEKSHQELNKLLNEKDKQIESLEAKQVELQSELERARSDLEQVQVPDAKLLQAAMENDKVAASRAIAQNSQLKKQLEELQEAVDRLNKSKLELTELLEEEQKKNHELHVKLTGLAQTNGAQLEFGIQVGSPLVTSITSSCSQTTYHDISPDDIEQPDLNPEAVLLLQQKFRKVINDLADMSEEKQRLEHLVIQLQGETETIEEYIALYQSQRYLLQQRVCQKDREMAKLAKEKELLRDKLTQLAELVPNLVNGAAEDGAGEKVLSLVNEIGASSLVQEVPEEAEEAPEFGPHPPSPHRSLHPCPACPSCPTCSGSLITV